MNRKPVQSSLKLGWRRVVCARRYGVTAPRFVSLMVLPSSFESFRESDWHESCREGHQVIVMSGGVCRRRNAVSFPLVLRHRLSTETVLDLKDTKDKASSLSCVRGKRCWFSWQFSCFSFLRARKGNMSFLPIFFFFGWGKKLLLLSCYLYCIVRLVARRTAPGSCVLFWYDTSTRKRWN